MDVEYSLNGELGASFDDNEDLFKLFKDALQEKINSVFEEMIVLEDVDGNEKRAVLFNSWETDMHYLSDN